MEETEMQPRTCEMRPWVWIFVHAACFDTGRSATYYSVLGKAATEQR
jgi:hypothetical protein